MLPIQAAAGVPIYGNISCPLGYLAGGASCYFARYVWRTSFNYVDAVLSFVQLFVYSVVTQFLINSYHYYYFHYQYGELPNWELFLSIGLPSGWLGMLLRQFGELHGGLSGALLHHQGRTCCHHWLQGRAGFADRWVCTIVLIVPMVCTHTCRWCFADR